MALKAADAARAKAAAKMCAQQESARFIWTDVEYLRTAVEQVIACRRVLKYTYVMSYLQRDDTPEKALLEHQQEMLEKTTERLHEYTEMAEPQDHRAAIVNLTRVADKFLAALQESLSDGVVVISSSSSSSSSPVVVVVV